MVCWKWHIRGGGRRSIVEIDEALMRGRRKYNRGRLLIGDVIDSIPAHNIRINNYGFASMVRGCLA